jgi:5-methylcytosine-specific restriction endonuclease McrA
MFVKPAGDVISDCFKGAVLIMDPVDYSTYKFDEWLERDRLSHFSPEDKVIQCVKFNIRVPEIAIDCDYSDVPDLELKWNKKNLTLRDHNECQYCGKKVYGEQLTIDHVHPQSRGGKNSWSNTVVACEHCNRRKANKTPEEAGMVLRKKPVKPKWYPLTARFSAKMPSSWAKWVPNFDMHPMNT